MMKSCLFIINHLVNLIRSVHKDLPPSPLPQPSVPFKKSNDFSIFVSTDNTSYERNKTALAVRRF